MKSKYRKLEALYKKIPTIECKGLCHQACTIVPAAKIEIKRARERLAKNPFNPIAMVREMEINPRNPSVPSCSALKNGRCSIYNIRPAICRLYGVAQGLECPFGCVPKIGISRQEAYELVREIELL